MFAYTPEGKARIVSAEVEYFAGSLCLGSRSVLTEDEELDGMRIDFGHYILTGVDGIRYHRPMLLIDPSPAEVIAVLMTAGCVDAHCCEI